MSTNATPKQPADSNRGRTEPRNNGDPLSRTATASDQAPATATRVVLYTGKGGVGKSTIAASSAALAAAAGARTLVMSIDSAHNLSDIFGRRIGHEPSRLAPGLEALEVDINREIHENWSAVIDFFRNLTVTSSLAHRVVAEECAILPGMEEVFGLTRLRKLAEQGNYDLIVVDSPPTGDMLKILRMPDVLDWFMRKYYPLEKKIATSMRPLMSKMAGVPIPEDRYYDTVEDTYAQVQRVAALLMNHRISSLRLVMNPDTISLGETKRAYATVSLFGFNVDAILVNKVLPDEVRTGFFAKWIDTQREVLSEIETDFDEVPIFQAPLEESEPIGLDRLRAFGEQLYAGRPVKDVFVAEPALQLAGAGDAVELQLRIPFLNRDNFQIWVKDDVLLINLHNNRKQIPLPRALQGRQMEQASYRDGVLSVRFRASKG